jgi:hypothetical protein
MGTRSKTTVFDKNGRPLLSFYRQFDGYYEGHGAELQAFLRDMGITDGISITDRKTANGMGCLAAQLVKHFKNGIGGVYICNHSDSQEYNYEIHFLAPNKISLVGKTAFATPKFKTFNLYSMLPVQPLRKVCFVYHKAAYDSPTWRNIEVTNETGEYLEGIENGEFKRFLKSKILDGKIIEVAV